MCTVLSKLPLLPKILGILFVFFVIVMPYYCQSCSHCGWILPEASYKTNYCGVDLGIDIESPLWALALALIPGFGFSIFAITYPIRSSAIAEELHDML